MTQTLIRPEYETDSSITKESQNSIPRGYKPVQFIVRSVTTKKSNQRIALKSHDYHQIEYPYFQMVGHGQKIAKFVKEYSDCEYFGLKVQYSHTFQKVIDFYPNLAKIKEYFNASPQERVSIRKSYAKHIQTTEDVSTVLYLGNSPDFKDGYDGAVALLAECKQLVLSQSIQVFRQKLIHKNLVLTEEYKLEILIKSVACASLISSERKLALITSLFVRNLGRLTKLTLIDALIILEDEVDKELIEVCLERFTSKNESDEYVRVAAEEAIKDMQEG